ncbi:MAG: MBL fold metallo-hydrolase [Verrucomicrobiota bacterium]
MFALRKPLLYCLLLLATFNAPSYALDQARGTHQNHSEAISSSDAKENNQANDAKKNSQDDPRPRTKISWLGHGFLYLITSTDIRVAIDPFDYKKVNYTFPNNLSADIVLVTANTPDRSDWHRLIGDPQIFMSLTAIGTNQSNGILFKGISSFRDSQLEQGVGLNTIFTFSIDQVRYCALGALGHRINATLRRKIGRTDVLFLPIGNKALTPKHWWDIAEELKAKVIIPILYKTPKSGAYEMRNLDESGLENHKTIHLESNALALSSQKLPAEPTVFIFPTP